MFTFFVRHSLLSMQFYFIFGIFGFKLNEWRRSIIYVQHSYSVKMKNHKFGGENFNEGRSTLVFVEN